MLVATGQQGNVRKITRRSGGPAQDATKMGRARESHAAHFIAVLRLCPEIDRANQNTRDTRSFSASSFYGEVT